MKNPILLVELKFLHTTFSQKWIKGQMCALSWKVKIKWRECWKIWWKESAKMPDQWNVSLWRKKCSKRKRQKWKCYGERNGNHLINKVMCVSSDKTINNPSHIFLEPTILITYFTSFLDIAWSLNCIHSLLILTCSCNRTFAYF